MQGGGGQGSDGDGGREGEARQLSQDMHVGESGAAERSGRWERVLDFFTVSKQTPLSRERYQLFAARLGSVGSCTSAAKEATRRAEGTEQIANVSMPVCFGEVLADRMNEAVCHHRNRSGSIQ